MTITQGETGVQFFVNDDKVVYDVLIPDGVEVLDLDINVIGKVTVNLMDMDRRYESITQINIGSKIGRICIKNCQFPNVKKVHVDSKDSFFQDSDDGLLILNKTILLNTFEKEADEEINMEGITVVDQEAFNGCKSTRLVNLEDKVSYFCDENSTPLNGSAFEMADGVLTVGNSLLRVEEGALVHVHEKVNYVSPNVANSVQRFLVKNRQELRHLIAEMNILVKCAVDIHFAYDLDYDDLRLLKSNSFSMPVKRFIFDARQTIFTEQDGVIYAKDMKKICMFPRHKETPKFVIPDSVEVIGKRAFGDVRRVNEIYMPDSVKEIQDAAFSRSAIKSIKLSRSITAIEDGINNESGCFSLCELKRVVIPSNIKYIGDNSFRFSSLKEVVFEEGSAETIGISAFEDTALKTVSIPKSTKRMKYRSFMGVKDVRINGTDTKGILTSCLKCYAVSVNCDVSVFVIDGKILLVPTYIKSMKNGAALIERLQEKCDNREELVFEDSYASYEILLNEGTPMQKTEMAIALLEHFSSLDKPGVTECRNFLRKNGKRVINEMFTRKDYEKIIKIVRLADLTENALKDALHTAEDIRDTTLVSYILDSMNRLGYNRENKHSMTI